MANGPPAERSRAPPLLRAQNRDLLPLGKRQVPPRQRGLGDRRHPASLTEPPGPDRLRHAASTAASSLASPRAIAAQNRCLCSRLATGGRPGDRI